LEHIISNNLFPFIYTFYVVLCVHMVISMNGYLVPYARHRHVMINSIFQYNLLLHRRSYQIIALHIAVNMPDKWLVVVVHRSTTRSLGKHCSTDLKWKKIKPVTGCYSTIYKSWKYNINRNLLTWMTEWW